MHTNGMLPEPMAPGPCQPNYNLPECFSTDGGGCHWPNYGGQYLCVDGKVPSVTVVETQVQPLVGSGAPPPGRWDYDVMQAGKDGKGDVATRYSSRRGSQL